MAKRGNTAGTETRGRIIDAALASVRNEGVVGTSARGIARTGGFNQALIFYHFGSVEELLLAALERANERRVDHYRRRLGEVTDLAGLVAVAVDLHTEQASEDNSALAAIVAGWGPNSELAARVIDGLRPWDELIAETLQRVLSPSPLADALPIDDIAHAITSLFLGIELLARLEPDDTRTTSLYESLATGARLVSMLVPGGGTEPQ